LSLKSKLQLAQLLLSRRSPQRQQARHVVRMWAKGVDLRGVSVKDLGLDEQRSIWYSDSSGEDLDAVFRTFEISREDAVLDLGCGKGGAVITLCRYPFAHVDGLDLAPAMVDIARRNLSRLRITKARLFCSDAETFTDLDQYTYLYMYHPFLETVMRRVLENVCASLGRRQRRLTLVYRNPVYDGLVIQAGLSQVREFSHSTDLIRVYRNA
jgi:SAM-dependent methyltransferase